VSTRAPLAGGAREKSFFGFRLDFNCADCIIMADVARGRGR